ncbi:hypothetical protein ACQ4PT_033393 [Festuca glaucescens]
MGTAAKTTSLLLLLLPFFSLSVAQNVTQREAGILNVGAILNLQSLVGKIARTSILMAMEDFYAVHRNYTTKLVLHIRDSNGDNIQAASEEATFVSNIGNKSQVPVISFTATNPALSSTNVPYFLRATLSDAAQVNSLAALIKAYGWREVVPIYEETDFGRGIIPYLVDALQEVGASMPYRSGISQSPNSDQVEQELYKLMTMQTRVYIVHMSSSIGSILFTKAKELGMMSDGYAWIVTDGIANIINSISPLVLDAMDGVLGVRFYVPKTKELGDFTTRWTMRYKQDNPNDPPKEPSIFGLRGDDTIWALAQAAEKIINVVRSESKEIGFWSAKSGIHQNLNQNGYRDTYLNSIPDLSPVDWPGEENIVPKGWQIPTYGKKLRVGVRTSGYPEFMKVERDPIRL